MRNLLWDFSFARVLSCPLDCCVAMDPDSLTTDQLRRWAEACSTVALLQVVQVCREGFSNGAGIRQTPGTGPARQQHCRAHPLSRVVRARRGCRLKPPEVHRVVLLPRPRSPHRPLLCRLSALSVICLARIQHAIDAANGVAGIGITFAALVTTRVGGDSVSSISWVCSV